MKKITVIIFSLLFSTLLIAQQKEANVWVFGKRTGLDFNNSPPTPFGIEDNIQILTQEGCASIADADGNLLFYTDGVTIWDRENGVMETGLNGHFSSTQSGVIVPLPDTPDIFYVFTVPYQGEPEGLQYSIVDMTLNGGMGDVTEKNIQLVTPVDEKVTAMSHDNAEDIWVVTHEWQHPITPGGDTIPSNNFVAYLVTKDGVDIDNPVISSVGLAHGGNDLNTVGYLKGSPGNNRIALAMYFDEVYQLFDFDNVTGEISYPITFSGYKKAYGLEFSPNSRILYLSEEDSIETEKMHIYQFDLLAGSAQEIIDSRNYIGYTTNNAAIGRGALQVGPDQRIYVARGEMPWLGVINNPNLWGSACELVDDGIWLESNTAYISKYGLPTFIQSYFSPPAFDYTNNCFGEYTEFWIETDITGNIGVEWDFGDGGFSTELEPTHLFTAPGQHIVKLTVHYISTDRHAEEAITILTSPVPGFTYDDYCVGSPTQFYDNSDPISGEIVEWLWDFGDDTSTLKNPQHTFSTGGQQTVELYVKTDNGCFKTDNGTVDPIPAPGTPGQPTGPTAMCENSENSVYNTSGHPDAVTYFWEITPAAAGTIAGNSTSATVNWDNTFSGTANIKVTSINVCQEMGSASSPLQVTIHQKPYVDAGPDDNSTYLTAYTFNNSNVDGSGPFEYAWTPTSSLVPPTDILHPTSILLEFSTRFFLEAVDTYGCVDHDSVLITITGGQVYGQIIPDNYVICYGSSTTLHVVPGGGSGNYDYNWTSIPVGFFSNERDPVVTPEENTEYFLELLDAENPENNYYGSIPIEVKPLPWVLTPDTVLCYNGATMDISCEYGGGNGGPYQWWWEPDFMLQTNSLPDVTTVPLDYSQQYDIVLTDNFGCKSYDTTFVRVSDDVLSVEAIADEYVLCWGEITYVSAIAQGGMPLDYQYEWFPHEAVQNFQASSTATNPIYSTKNITIEVWDGFNLVSDVIEIQMNPLPDINLIPTGSTIFGEDTIITCVYDTIYLRAGETTGYDYQWSRYDDDTLFFIEVWTTGIGFDIQHFSVVVQNQETLCTDSSEITIIYSFDYCAEGIADKELGDEYMYAYPNPTTGKMNIAMYGIMGESEMYIMNMTGQLVYSEKVSNRSNQESIVMEIDLEGRPKGIYILFLVNDKGLHSDKIILQ